MKTHQRWIEALESVVPGNSQAAFGGGPGEKGWKQYLACGLSYFVLFHSDKAVLDQAAARLTEWLSDMGLELKPSKTKVTHTLTPVGGNVGFDFLGFTIRQFLVGKTHSGTHPHGGMLGFKTLIRPSKEGIKRHIHDMNQRLRKVRSASQETLVKELNPVIRGWANYYRTVCSSRVFSWCDHVLYLQLDRKSVV
jgi:RNA-directed DNA polymerase